MNKDSNKKNPLIFVLQNIFLALKSIALFFVNVFFIIPFNMLFGHKHRSMPTTSAQPENTTTKPQKMAISANAASDDKYTHLEQSIEKNEHDYSKR